MWIWNCAIVCWLFFFFWWGCINLLPVKMTTLFLEFNYDIYCTYNIQTSDRLAVKIQYISFYLFTVTNKLFPFMHLFKIRHFAEKKNVWADYVFFCNNRNLLKLPCGFTLKSFFCLYLHSLIGYCNYWSAYSTCK